MMFRFPILNSPISTVSEHEEGRSQIEGFKDPRCFEAGTGLKGIKGPRCTKIKQEAEVTKTGPSGLPNCTIRFSRLDRVRVGFGDFICLGKIWSYLTQRVMSCYLYKYRSRPIIREIEHNQSNYYFSYFLS
jgi:hypothetical protein